jgi:hypothetical protein
MTTATPVQFLFALASAAAFASAVAFWRRNEMAPTRAEFASVAVLVLFVSMLT